MAAMPQATGFGRRDLARAMEGLFHAGKIKVAVVGKQANRMPMKGIVRSGSPDDELLTANS
jgi:hypothetical protein